MNYCKFLLCLLFLFTVTVRIPMKGTFKYSDVIEVVPFEYYYELRMADAKRVYVPTFWTIVEEQ